MSTQSSIQSPLPLSVRHFYGIIIKSHDFINDHGFFARLLGQKSYRALSAGVPIPNTPYTVFHEVGDRYIITKSDNFINLHQDKQSNEVVVFTIPIPSLTDQLQFNTFSEQHNLPHAAIHNLALYVS